MKKCKISGFIVFAVVAISDALQSNLSMLESKIKLNEGEDTYPPFVTLNENQYEYVVSFGKLKDRNYVHLCFAVMIVVNYGYTCTTCIDSELLGGARHIKYRSNSGMEPESMLMVDQYLGFDSYNSQIRKIETHTNLLVFKLDDHCDYLDTSMTGPRYEFGETKEIIGYKADCDEPNFSVSNIVTVPVIDDEARGWDLVDNPDSIYIFLLESKVKLSSVDRGGVLLSKTGRIRGILTEPEKGLYLSLIAHSEFFCDVLNYMVHQRHYYHK